MTFENLRVYQAAELLDQCVIAVIELIPRGFARDIDQLKRASAAVLHNIAEAHGNDVGRKVLHLEIARGSADETRSVLRSLVARGALPRNAIQRPCNLAVSVAKMLTAWIDRLT